ncbi:MAG: glycosyltransferase family A protein [Aliarcobacter sp.]|nr:glycosyltransferase family A protein [Aliarcobacter sp.]
MDHRYFEWIIIDDGSTDNTKEKIDNFIENSPYKIKYYYQENQGKHICYNKAIDIAEGELFLILDSDDEIVNNCLETFWNYWENLSQTTKDELFSINCLCKDGYTNKRIGFELEEGLFQDAFKWRYANKITFDTWGAVSTKTF